MVTRPNAAGEDHARQKATITNTFLGLYPKKALAQMLGTKPELKKVIWQLLSEIAPNFLLHEGRVYGGGLYKLEPKELAKVPASEIAQIVNYVSKDT